MDIAIPIALLLFFLAAIYGIGKEMVKRPTYDYVEKKYMEAKMCDVLNTQVNKTLEKQGMAIDEIKEEVKGFMEVRRDIKQILDNQRKT